MSRSYPSPHRSLAWSLSALALSASLGASLSGCSPLPAECTEDKSCRDKHGATFYCAEDQICDQYTQAQYTAAPCNFEVSGPVFEPGTVNVGVILALARGADYFGLIEPIAKAIKLAQKDVNTGAGIDGKKLGIIFCNTDGKNDQAQAAAQHLANIGVQAIIGPDFSGYTLDVATKVLIPNNMLAISPSATAPAISGLNDKDLIWRTVASDKIQTVALSGLIDHVVKNVVKPAGGATPKVAMLTREGDSYANGLNQGVIEALPSGFTDSKIFLGVNYPNSGANGGDDYSQVSINVANFNPDVVLIWGLTEVWDIALQIDSLMESDHQRQDVIYIVADGGKDTVKAQDAGQRRPSLSGRLWGTSPRSLSADEYPPYKAFGVRWRSEYNSDADTHPFIANGYDAVYLIAFAVAGAAELTGVELAKAMRRLSDPNGTAVTANQQDLQRGVTAMKNGGKLKISGASGPIDFNESGDPKSTTISLWCLESRAIVEKGDLLKAGSTTFNPFNCPYTPTPRE